MNPKLIYTASEAMKHKVAWNRVTNESEWIYIGERDEVNGEFVTDNINNHFTDEMLYISWTRQNSFDGTKETVGSLIKELLGKEDFFIWDTKFKHVIEFNHIGVMRRGQVSS